MTSALTFHKVEYGGRCTEGCSRSAKYTVLLLGYPLDGEGTRTVVCGRCKARMAGEYRGALEGEREAAAA